MDETKKFQISILGETIRLNSDESLEHMNNVSSHIEERVRTVNRMGVSPDMSAASRLLFAMVLLTDEFLKVKATSERQEALLKEAEINRETAKKELEDFVFMFDKNNGNPKI